MTRHPRHPVRHDGPRVGVALGGGGARGLAHIPILEAFDELGVKPAAIAGTSIGAIVGAAYASGIPAAALRDHVLAAFRHRGEVLARLWKLRYERFRDILAPSIGNPAQLKAESLLEAFLPEGVARDFAMLEIPFTAVATDFYAGKAVGITSGPLRPAVAASMAIPMMFRPVVIGDKVLIDGGVTDPLPFGHVRRNVDVVVAVDVINRPKGAAPTVPSPYEAIFGATQILMQAVIAERLAHGQPDVLIRPNINVFRVLDFLKARAIIRAAEPAKDEMKRALEQALKRF
ncbi:NTE family protein [Tepidamorphus gemmatus]|uniref:NTE family protein n=1 Tax=Tepidamorphus gemmatus TaxID=747076 RepID=A0A4R3MCK1_9HYPH|nr:patatin-like phospholipase family protein [Tepidamorphus gemmatus]TCT09979.1 NTE family protein [Tepidamorphus gemmatus]